MLRSLNYHNIKMHNVKTFNKMFDCQKCDYKTSKLTLLKTHTKNKHRVKKRVKKLTLKCLKNCPFKTKHLDVLQLHQSRVHLACHTCDIMFKTKNEHFHHCSHVHNQKVHVCEVCNYFGYKVLTTNGLIKCDHCDLYSKDRSKVNFHMKKIHENVTPVTEDMAVVTKNVTAVTNDVTLVTKSNSSHENVTPVTWTEDLPALTKDVTSRTEDYKTHISGNFKRHLMSRQHKSNGLIKCDYCDFYSKYRSKVNFHIKKIHENVTPVTVDLTTVTKDVTSPTEDVTEDRSVCLEDVTTVTNDVTLVTKCNRSHEKPFECDICGLRTNFLETLSQHITVVHLKMAVHYSDKFRCDKCDFMRVWKYLIYQSVHKKGTQQ
jgi:hypothetical protein